jgi:hypothetical protein
MHYAVASAVKAAGIAREDVLMRTQELALPGLDDLSYASFGT